MRPRLYAGCGCFGPSAGIGCLTTLIGYAAAAALAATIAKRATR